jgi:predicted dehydrogenase
MIKVVIIGAGYMAREHAKAISNIDGVGIVGAMGRSRAKAQSFCNEFDIDVCAETLPELHEKTQADALVIAVNELSSPAIIMEALNLPWIILAEKPVSLDLEEVQKIEKKRMALERKLFVAMNRRHYGSTIAARELLENDKNTRVVEIHDQENILAALASGTPKEVVSNWMVANSIHLVDYLSVFCRGKLNEFRLIEKLNTEKPFLSMATLKFDSGDLGFYTAFWNAPGPWSVKITTREQLLEMRPLEGLERQVFPEKSKTRISLPAVDKNYKPGVYQQAEQLVAATRSQHHSLPTLSEYLETHKLVDKLYPHRISI